MVCRNVQQARSRHSERQDPLVPITAAGDCQALCRPRDQIVGSPKRQRLTSMVGLDGLHIDAT